MATASAPYQPTLVAGIEARGFIFGAGIAHQLGLGFVPVRKSKKLPGAVIGIDYELEYGVDRLEIHNDVLGPDDRVLIIDDLIATGGTATATVNLIRMAGAKVSAACFLSICRTLAGRIGCARRRCRSRRFWCSKAIRPQLAGQACTSFSSRRSSGASTFARSCPRFRMIPASPTSAHMPWR